MFILGDTGIPLLIIYSRHGEQYSRMLTAALFVMGKKKKFLGQLKYPSTRAWINTLC